MKTWKQLTFVAFIAIFGLVVFIACDNGNNSSNNSNGIDWISNPNGTLTIVNNTTNDMVMFQGQTPQANNILGGIKAMSTRNFDISETAYEYQNGGYFVLRGMTLSEYYSNFSYLSIANIAYSEMVTYGPGKKFRTEINTNSIGDYVYRGTNQGRIGVILRKDNIYGEKLGYLPALATNMLLYSDSTNSLSVYPTFVHYHRSSGAITTFVPSTPQGSVSISPKPITGSDIQAYSFLIEEGSSWQSIVNTLISPVAYLTVSNNATNQASVTIGETNRLTSQNGYTSIDSGEKLTFEIQSTIAGSEQNIVLTFNNGTLQIPVTMGGVTPTLKNGYDYTVTVSGSGQTPEGYTATMTESATARDLSSELEAL